MPIGAGIGAFLSGPILVMFSRRHSLMIADVLGIVGMLVEIVGNLYVLYLGRLIFGMAVGLNTALVSNFSI